MLCPLKFNGQSLVYVDNCIDGQGKENVILLDFDIIGGYNIGKDLDIFGGVRFSNYFFDFEVPEEIKYNVASSFLLLFLHADITNYFKVLAFDEDTVFKSFSFFPEFRFFFNPWLPRNVPYEEDGIIHYKKGIFKTQTSFGYGGGLFFKTNSGLIAPIYSAMKEDSLYDIKLSSRLDSESNVVIKNFGIYLSSALCYSRRNFISDR